MIRYVTTRWHGYTVEPARRQLGAPPVEVVHYDRLIVSRRLPRRPHVFTDLDRLAPFDLELVAVLHHGLAGAGVPVLNDPARAKGRFALLRALHEAGLNDFNAYRVDEGVRPARYPVFLRQDSGHGRPLSGLLEDRDGVCAAVEAQLERGVPSASLLLVEYAAEALPEGVFRKLSHWRVGDWHGPGISLHERSWNVKYGKKNHTTPELYAESLRIVREDPYGDVLRKAFEIAEIEYGRADYGIVGGRPQVYEINTNPLVPFQKAHASAHQSEARRRVEAAYYAALSDLDARESGRGGRVRVRDSRLHRFRGRRILAPWTRRMP